MKCLFRTVGFYFSQGVKVTSYSLEIAFFQMEKQCNYYSVLFIVLTLFFYSRNWKSKCVCASHLLLNTLLCIRCYLKDVYNKQLLLCLTVACVVLKLETVHLPIFLTISVLFRKCFKARCFKTHLIIDLKLKQVLNKINFRQLCCF